MEVSKYTWCLTSTETIKLIRDGKKKMCVCVGGGGGKYVSTHGA